MLHTETAARCPLEHFHLLLRPTAETLLQASPIAILVVHLFHVLKVVLVLCLLPALELVVSRAFPQTECQLGEGAGKLSLLS